jgi:hypothetical protein
MMKSVASFVVQILLRGGFGMLVAAVIIIASNIGCQSDFSVGLSNKVFHPDNSKGNPVGDPRKGMYDGSGYHEGVNAGDVKQNSGFRTIGEAGR